jgi:hypothetical protein
MSGTGLAQLGRWRVLVARDRQRSSTLARSPTEKLASLIKVGRAVVGPAARNEMETASRIRARPWQPIAGPAG